MPEADVRVLPARVLRLRLQIAREALSLVPA